MEDKIKLNCGCCKLSFTVCDTIKGFLGNLLIFIIYSACYDYIYAANTLFYIKMIYIYLY